MPVGGVVFRPLNFPIENLSIESSSLLRIVGGNFEINHIWHGVIKPRSFLFYRLVRLESLNCLVHRWIVNRKTALLESIELPHIK